MVLEKWQSVATITKLTHTVIIHDHDIFCQGLYSLLKVTSGFEMVTEVCWSTDAEALLSTSLVDLMILDTYLPPAEILGLIQILHSSAKVVLLAPQLDESLLLEAMLAGASGFLTKDIPANEMLDALLGMTRGQLAMSSSLTTRLVALLVERCRSQIPAPRSLPALVLSSSGFFHTSNAIDGVAPSSLLTPQEAKVFQWLCQGLTNKQIGAQLAISPYTVGKHVQHILHKLGVANRTQAAAAYPAGFEVSRDEDAQLVQNKDRVIEEC